MIVLHDSGGGVTQESLEFFQRNYRRIGEIRAVNIDQHRDFSMEIVGVDGIMLLSGCNCGYGGEGPHGSVAILETLKVLNEETRSLVFSSSVVHIRYQSNGATAVWKERE